VERQRIASGSPYEPVFGFSRAVRAGNHVYVAGTAPVMPAGEELPLDAYGQTKRCLEIIVAALREAGATVLTTARSRPENLSNAEHFVVADVSTVEGCAAVADAVRDRLGGVDIVVDVVGGSAAPAGGFAVRESMRLDRRCRAVGPNRLPAPLVTV